MYPVSTELVSKLDTTTAKTGDSVVVKTESSVKTADGVVIPKGSKVVGHVTAVQPHGDGNSNQDAQMAIQFDHAVLKGGQNLPIHSEIRSLAPPESQAAASGPYGSGAGAAGMSGSPAAGATAGGMGGSRPSGATQGTVPPEAGVAPATGASGDGTAAGTVVARTGSIAIRTTSIPGVLLASNAPGQHDPRMASSSGILLGARGNIHLDGGTQLVLGVAGAGAQAH